jgi:hypothetical protein
MILADDFLNTLNAPAPGGPGKRATMLCRVRQWADRDIRCSSSLLFSTPLEEALPLSSLPDGRRVYVINNMRLFHLIE